MRINFFLFLHAKNGHSIINLTHYQFLSWSGLRGTEQIYGYTSFLSLRKKEIIDNLMCDDKKDRVEFF